MKYVSEKYKVQLDELAGSLMRNKQLKLGELAVAEPEQPGGAQILSFPTAQVINLHTPDNIQLGQE